MPVYLYEDDKTGKVYEVVQKMNETHEFFLNGRKLRRVFTIPQASIDTRCNPYSESDFLKITNKRGGTVGQVEDIAKELSEKRGGQDGDPILQKHYKEWSKKRNGKDHPDVVKKKRAERLKKIENKYGVIVKDV